MPALSGKTGLYGIFNLMSGKVYIGSAINLKKRLRQHKEHLKKQKHYNSYLQNAWNKYGEKEFEFHVLEHCLKEQLIEREQFYLDSLKSYDDEFGYNICKIAGSTIGQKPWLNKKHTEETRKKMSVAGLKRYENPLERQKISLRSIGKKYWLGRKHTEETKRKISKGNKGKIVGLFQRMAVSESSKKRTKFSLEQACEIRHLYSDGLSYRKLMKMFNCSAGAINNVLKGKGYLYSTLEGLYASACG